jgi:hypothetical protein
MLGCKVLYVVLVISTLQPHISTLQPHISTLQPHTSTLQPHISTLQPHVSTLQPHISTLQPHIRIEHKYLFLYLAENKSSYRAAVVIFTVYLKPAATACKKLRHRKGDACSEWLLGKPKFYKWHQKRALKSSSFFFCFAWRWRQPVCEI